MCGSNIKKEITLKKHKHTKHDPKYYPSNNKIGQGKFGFAIRPGKEVATEALRLEWSKEKNDEKNIVDDKVHGTVQPPPYRMIKGGTLCFFCQLMY